MGTIKNNKDNTINENSISAKLVNNLEEYNNVNKETKDKIERLAKAEMSKDAGFFGKIFGSRIANAVVNITFILCFILLLFFFIYLIYCLANHLEINLEILTCIIPVITLSLGYLFGYNAR